MSVDHRELGRLFYAEGDRWLISVKDDYGSTSRTAIIIDLKKKLVITDVPPRRIKEVMAAHCHFHSKPLWQYAQSIFLKLVELACFFLILLLIIRTLMDQYVGADVYGLKIDNRWVIGSVLMSVLLMLTSRSSETDFHLNDYLSVKRYRYPEYIFQGIRAKQVNTMLMPFSFKDAQSVWLLIMIVTVGVLCSGNYERYLRKQYLESLQPTLLTDASFTSPRLSSIVTKNQHRHVNSFNDPELQAVFQDLFRVTYGRSYDPKLMPIMIVDEQSYIKAGYPETLGHTSLHSNMIVICEGRFLQVLETLGHEIGHNLRYTAKKMYWEDGPNAGVADELMAYCGEVIWMRNFCKRYELEYRHLDLDSRQLIFNSRSIPFGTRTSRWKGDLMLGKHYYGRLQFHKLMVYFNQDPFAVLRYVMNATDEQIARQIGKSVNTYPDSSNVIQFIGFLPFDDHPLNKASVVHYRMENGYQFYLVRGEEDLDLNSYYPDFRSAFLTTQNNQIVDACDLKQGKVFQGVGSPSSDVFFEAVIDRITAGMRIRANRDLHVFAEKEPMMKRVARMNFLEFDSIHLITLSEDRRSLIVRTPSIHGHINIVNGQLIPPAYGVESDVLEALAKHVKRLLSLP